MRTQPETTIDSTQAPSRKERVDTRVLVVVPEIDCGIPAALSFARMLGHGFTCVHAAEDLTRLEETEALWKRVAGPETLTVLASRHQPTIDLLDAFIRQILEVEKPHQLIVVVPEFVPRKRWHFLLHVNLRKRLERTFKHAPALVIHGVCYSVND